MAKQIFSGYWHHVTLCLLLSFVSESQLRMTSNWDVALQDQDDCGSHQHIWAFNHYSVRLNFNHMYSCPHSRKGFQCGITLYSEDLYDVLGGRICVDLKDMAASIPHSQFAIILSQGNQEMQRVYQKSLRFDRAPNNIQCGPDPEIFNVNILLRVLSNVRVCPTILRTLENHNTSLGTVFIKQETPVRTLGPQCARDQLHLPFEERSILKVDLGLTAKSICTIPLLPPVHFRHTELETCFIVEYMSEDFRCEVALAVETGSSVLLSENLPTQSNWRRSERREHCFRFEVHDQPQPWHTDDDTPTLVIRSDLYHCDGKFALEINFRDVTYDRDHDDEADTGLNVRNLYMSVFISVISVCIFILGLTCLCCVRMRARSRQQSQGRRSQSATANTGFDGNPVHGDSPAFWTSTSSDQVFGLPSYEEATNGFSRSQSLGSVPSSPDQIEKPPAYETLYTDQISPPSTSALPPPPPPPPEEPGPLSPTAPTPSSPGN